MAGSTKSLIVLGALALSPLRPVLAAAPAAPAAPAVQADTDSPAGGAEAVDKQNLAFKVSPQDMNFDHNKIDDDEKFSAPKKAPNDKQAAPHGDAAPDRDPAAVPGSDSLPRSGSKGSKILDDYDPNRLGVSADEAKSGKDAKLGAKQGKQEPAKGETKGDAKGGDAHGDAKDAKKNKDTRLSQAKAGSADDTKAKAPSDVKESKDSLPPTEADLSAGSIDDTAPAGALLHDSRGSKPVSKIPSNVAPLASASAVLPPGANYASAPAGSKFTVVSSPVALLQAQQAPSALPVAISGFANWPSAPAAVHAAKGASELTPPPATLATATTSSKAAVPTTTTSSAAKLASIETEAAPPNSNAKSDEEEKKQEAQQLKQESNKADSTSDAEEDLADDILHSERSISKFIGAALMIVTSEIGDKTFFIAALMAMRHPQLFVFSSSYSAMVVMTVLSMILGLVLPSLLSKRVTTLLAAGLFLVFGVRLLREGWHMDRSIGATDELADVENDLEMHESTHASEKAEGGGTARGPVRQSSLKQRFSGLANLAALVFSPVWIQIFAMTFLGEWGDRSQIATVVMGAGGGFMSVLAGCLVGHLITTFIAVLGGKILAQHLSLRTITLSGAACFLLFAFIYVDDWFRQ